MAQHGKRASADSIGTDESDNDEYDSGAIDSRGEDDSSDVILAFINSVLFWYRATSYFRKEKVYMIGFICPPVPSQSGAHQAVIGFSLQTETVIFSSLLNAKKYE